MSHTGDEAHRPSGSWGRPAAEPGAGWAVVDVETTGFRPGQARIVSVAALAVGDDGNVEHSVSSLLNPGVDPGPTHVHGLTAEMLAGKPCFADVAAELIEVLRGRTLVAHNVSFDYSFLAAEAELAGVELPIDSVMCTVELARRLDLGTDNMRLETLAAHWGVSQMKPHDALDDALVLAQILKPALVRARERKVWLPLRPVGQRRWPSGLVTHDELRPLKMLASRMPCPYLNPGRFVRGRPLVQGMRVALSAEVNRTHEELVERILHAGLAYTDAVDPETSVVICNRARARTGQGLSGPRARRSAGIRRRVHGLPRRRGRRHRHRGVHRRHPHGRAVRSVLRSLRPRRAPRDPGRERDRQLAQPRHGRIARVLADTAEVDPIVGKAIEHGLHHHLEHDARQRRTDAAMRAESERDVTVGCAVQDHLAGPVEFSLRRGWRRSS